MPTVSVQAGGGGDYTTIQTAVDDVDISTEIYTISIDDNSNYNESVLIDEGISPDATHYIHITVNSANRHSGVWDTGKARMAKTGAGHIIEVRDDYTVIEGLQFYRGSSAAVSDECVRFAAGSTNSLIFDCIAWTDQTTIQLDGFYAGNWGTTVYVYNCILYGFTRAGIHAQNWIGSDSQTWFIDFCTVIKSGQSGTADCGNIEARDDSTGTVTMNVYNTACLDAINGDDFDSRDAYVTWSGTHNACSDTSLTSRGLTTGAQENLTLGDVSQASGSHFVVKETATGSEDYRLLDDAGGNKAYGNGTDRVGSEPDSREDFSLDIEGDTRSTTTPSPDIGADEFISVGGSNIPILYHHYKHMMSV